MHLLRIEHAVPSYEGWKKVFDDDPLGRRKSGVTRHRVMRPVDDEKYVIVDLEFASASEAEAMLSRLRQMWTKLDWMKEPRTRIVEVTEERVP